jgi:hypothetical protein
VVYAAPKELAMAMLGEGDDGSTTLLTDMQQALRGLAPGQVEQVPTDDDRRPFEQFEARRRP